MDKTNQVHSFRWTLKKVGADNRGRCKRHGSAVARWRRITSMKSKAKIVGLWY